MALRTTGLSPARITNGANFEEPTEFHPSRYFEVPQQVVTEYKHGRRRGHGNTEKNLMKTACINSKRKNSNETTSGGTQTKISDLYRGSEERLSELIPRINARFSKPWLSVMETFNTGIRTALRSRVEKVECMDTNYEILAIESPDKHDALLIEPEAGLSDKATELYLSIVEDLKNISGKIEDLRAFEFDVKLIIANKDRRKLCIGSGSPGKTRKPTDKTTNPSTMGRKDRYDIDDVESEYKEVMSQFSPKEFQNTTIEEIDKTARESNIMAKTYALLGLYPALQLTKQASPPSQNATEPAKMTPGKMSAFLLKTPEDKTKTLITNDLTSAVESFKKLKNFALEKSKDLKQTAEKSTIGSRKTNTEQRKSPINTPGTFVLLSKKYTNLQKANSQAQLTPGSPVLVNNQERSDSVKLEIKTSNKFNNPFLYEWKQ